MRIILHIGSDKTGTTALQRALTTRRQDLDDAGVHYPDFDGRPDHLWLAKSKPTTITIPADTRLLVLSSEAFWSLPSPGIRQLLQTLPEGPVEVVAYVRDPVAHAEAAFGQRCQMATSEAELRALLLARKLPGAVNPIPARARRRLAQLQAWEREPGCELRVRSYLADSDSRFDVVSDFFTSAELPPLAATPSASPASPTSPRANPSLNLDVVYASVIIRARHGATAQRRFLEHMAASSSVAVAAQPNFSPSLRQTIRDQTSDALKQLGSSHPGLVPLIEAAQSPVAPMPAYSPSRKAALHLAESKRPSPPFQA